MKKIKLTKKELRKYGRKKLLADFAYHLSSYCILLHEISHIVLGHTDYIRDSLKIEMLDEFGTDKNELSLEQLEILFAFEAEADRQAGEFLTGFFEHALGDSGLGDELTFPNLRCAYEFYIYVLTSICVLIQQLTNRKKGVHPLPNERQYILQSSVASYLSIHKPKIANPINTHIAFSAMNAAKKMGLVDGWEVQTVVSNAIKFQEIDEVINKNNIREFQHSVKRLDVLAQT